MQRNQPDMNKAHSSQTSALVTTSEKENISDIRILMALGGTRWRWAILLLFVLFLGYLIRIKTSYFDVRLIQDGDTPIEWVYWQENPAAYSTNFPGPLSNFHRSLFMHLYRVFYHFLGVSPEDLILYVVGAEVVFTYVGFFLLSKTLLPSADSVVHLLTAALVSGSLVRQIDLSRFWFPHGGFHYNWADLMRILAIILALKRADGWAWIFLALCCMTHPGIGFGSIVFVVAMQCVNFRSVNKVRLFSGVVTFIALFGTWFILFYLSAHLDRGEIPKDQWFAMTKFSNYHWYAFSSLYWKFTDRSIFLLEGRVPGLLSFLVLFALFSRALIRPVYHRKILSGCLAVASLSVIGILVSHFEINPALVKLCLQRSSALLIVIGLPVVVAGLWTELVSKNLVRSLLALGILLSPFLGVTSFPLLLTLSLCICRLIERYSPHNSSLAHVLVFLLIASCLILPQLGYYEPSILGSLRPHWRLAMLLILVRCVVMFVPFHQHASAGPNLIWPIFSIAVFLYCGYQGAYSATAIGLPGLEKARANKEAQLWARENTPLGSLFMVDPASPYGWRVFSRRSSFGFVHEWFSSWNYDSNKAVFDAGMARIKEFGVDLDYYVSQRPVMAGYDPLITEIQRRYYAGGDEFRNRIASRYGVNYFVLSKDRFDERTNLKRVFVNKHFVILAAKSEMSVSDSAGLRNPLAR